MEGGGRQFPVVNWIVSQGSEAEESWVGGAEWRHFNSFTMPAFTVNMLAGWIS